MGRRAYQRFAVRPTSEGVVRVFRDVLVQQSSQTELIVVGNEPGVVDSMMTIELHGAEDLSSQRIVTVRVANSQPFVVDGAVRHRLTLQVLTPAPEVSVRVEAPGEEMSWSAERS